MRFWQAWALSALCLATGLLLALIFGWLPLYGQSWSAGPLARSAPYALPLALGAGAGLSFAPLLLARWHGRNLRPTAGRIAGTVALLMSLPAALTGQFWPLNPGPLHLYLIASHPDPGLKLRSLAGLILAGALLWPLVCAMLARVPQPWKVPAFGLMPFGTWCFLMISGGYI